MPFGHPWWEVLYRLTVLMELADAVYKYLCLFWCLSGRLRMLEGRWNCGELTGNYGKIGTAWAIAKKWEATEATETRPTSGFFVGLSRSHMLSHLGPPRGDSDFLRRMAPSPRDLLRSQHVYSIHNHHRVAAKVKSHRADGRNRCTQLWWIPSRWVIKGPWLVGLYR